MTDVGWRDGGTRAALARLVDVVRLVDDRIVVAGRVRGTVATSDPVSALAAVIYSDFYCALPADDARTTTVRGHDVLGRLWRAVGTAFRAAPMHDTFFHVFAGLPERRGADAEARVYWNVTADGACALVSDVLPRLARLGIPVHFKCSTHPWGYARTDAAVLYVRASEADLVWSIASDAPSRLAGSLRSTTPAFTHRLAPGVAFAESPASGQSFGSERAHVCAQGMLNAHRRRVPAPALHGDVSAWLARRGYDADALFREPGTHYPYAFTGPARAA